MFHYVYCITNKLDTRRYIGCRSSRTLPELDTNYMGSSKSLTADINALGKENFHKHIMCVCSTRKSALEIESGLHKFYDVARNPAFYNRAIQTSTGFDITGTHQTQERRDKISAIQMGRVISEETKKKMSAAKKGKPLRPEVVEKMRGRTASAETRQKISSARRGKCVGKDNPNYKKEATDATRRKMSVAKFKHIDMELVLSLLSLGFSRRAVARKLCCSHQTINNRIKNYDKK